jgi:hypothetical protein
MANGIPVRLSEALATRARSAAQVLDRSLTEQVEHWARLGQVVESAISAATVERLKARSHDPQLAERLAVAKTPAGRARAAELIRKRNEVRYGLGPNGEIERQVGREKRAKLSKAR